METIQQQGQYLCYIIAIFGACIFLIQIYAISFYKKERGVITRYHRFLNENPDLDLEEALGNRQVPKDSPLRRRIALIKEAVRHKRPAAVSEFSALSDEHDHSHWFNSVPTTFIGLFLIFGLGGTLYLLNTLLDDSDLKSIVEASGDLNTIKLREAVGKLYGGFGHAFVASLAGIGATCGLVLVRGVFVNPIRGLFYHDLDSLTVTELLPRLQPRDVALPDALVITSRVLEQVGDKMLAMVEIVQAASDDNKTTSEFAQKSVAELSGFSDSMTTAADALDRSVCRLESTFGDDGAWARRSIALDKEMAELSEGIAGLTEKMERHSQLTQSLTDVSHKLEELLEESAAKITPVLPELREFLASHGQRILTVADRLAGIDANLVAVDRRLEATIGAKITHLATAFSNLQEVVIPLSKDQLTPLGANVLSLDGQITLLNSALQDGFPRMNTRLEKAEKEMTSVSGVLKSIEAKITPLQVAAEAVVEPLKAGTKAVEIIAGTEPASATRELASTNAALLAGQEALGKVIGPLLASLGALQEDITGIHTRLATVESAGNSIVDTGKSVESAIQTLAASTDQWNTNVAQLTGRMEEQTLESERLRKVIETRRDGQDEGGQETKGGFFHNWLGKQ